MLVLIGSRAARYHFPFFRKAKDFDFIGTREEIDEFLARYKHTITKSIPKKICARVYVGVRSSSFEFEIVGAGNESTDKIYALNTHKSHFDPILNIEYNIAAPEVLYLLKKSHICFNVHWKKNIGDYLFLKGEVDINKLTPEWEEIFNLRFKETKERVKYVERDFDVSNSNFFKVSERMVKRLLPHDNIHFATCFFDKPLFMSVKDDLSKAAMSEVKVNALPHDLKIKLIQEECMALTIEREILPCLAKKKEYNARQAYVDMAARMVYNYLPMFLRFFAADHFKEIVNLQEDFVAKFLNNVKGLDLEKFNESQTVN